MDWLIVVACVICAWAMLAIVGNERQVQLGRIEQRRKAAAEAARRADDDTPIEVREVESLKSR